MKYIVLDWPTYLSDRDFWEKLSQAYAMPLHIGTEK